MEKEMMPVHGIVSTVITPFFDDADKSIDFASYRKEIDLGARAGLAGFLCPCNAMESKFMTEEEKLAMVREGVDAAAGRVPIISSVMSYEHDLRMKQCETYMAAGADALCLNLPYKPEMTLEDYMAAVADLDSFHPKFVLLQDSSMADDGLPIEYFVKPFETFESVRGCKIEVKNSEPKYTKVIEATGGRMNVWGGFGNPSTIEAYDRGVIGMMPSGLFDLYQNINDLYFKKSRDAARRLFNAMSPILLQIYSGMRLGHYFHKNYFKRIGIFDTVVMRQPIPAYDSYQERICMETVDLALELQKRLPEFWRD